MRVIMAMLYDGLKSCVLCQKGAAYNKHIYVDDVCFSKKSKIPTDVSYVFIDWSDFNQAAYVNIPSERLILATRSETVAKETLPPCALIIHSATSLSQLFEMCRDVMRNYFKWGDELLSLVMNNGDIHQIVACAHSLLTNPIMILDNSMKVLAFTKEDAMDDEVWRLTVEKGYADLDAHSSLVLKRALSLLNENDCAYNHPMHGDSLASAKNVIINGNRVAIISLMQKNHSISDGDFSCLCYFGELLALYYKTHNYHNHLTDNRLEMIIIDILAGRFKNDAELSARIRNVNWLPKNNFYILTLRSQHTFLNTTQLKKICDSVVKFISHACAVIFDDNIVVLINHDHLESIPAQESNLMKKFLDKNHLSAGISNCENSISEIARLYRQSLIAIDMGNYLGLNENFFTFKEHRVNSMLYAFINLGDVENYFNPCIKQLLEYDTKKNAALLATLVSYLDNNSKQLKTANELFIQRGTLVYRLKKIEELCSIDLTDSDVIFDLQLSIRIFKLMNKDAVLH
ncbi:PucR family transcriptional regulator [Acetobacterium woodii]|uniref:Transcriptional regulator n=1 Tax=Acetobacterium woodii (strain ATCC 29683 / DSM 1030 / JCM 2381 / KCTC 1655 / WB1) TaxID=931626 RepID=H6LDY0_ACEWD|nr:helix-turn-helix domain-containing protein [Acetobacterium woodii]AFA48023.1 transcriptional regulator [Acetobacterium woodii DSM 1030]